MLPRTHEKLLQMSNLQQKYCQHGVAIQEPGKSNRNTAHATRISRHQGLDLLQRLQREDISQVPLAGIEMPGVSLCSAF